jgi:hypothetical protein
VSKIPFGSIVNQSTLGGLAGTTAATSINTTQKVSPSANLFMTELGNLVYPAETSPLKIPLGNQNSLYSLATGAASVIATTGFQTVSSFLASDNNTLFSLNRAAGRCTGEEALTYGNIFAVTNISAGTSTWRYLKKPTDMTQGPLVAESFCDRTVAGTATSSEFGPSYFTVNSAASSTTYTFAWVSDMTGDPEVFVMDATASATTIWNVSANKK